METTTETQEPIVTGASPAYPFGKYPKGKVGALIMAVRIFLLILIIIGIGLLFTQKLWVPRLVTAILQHENSTTR